MTIQEKVELLMQQVADLPDEVQADFVQSLIDRRAQDIGIYHLDEDERAALARSADDVRLGYFATDKEVDETFARHGA